MSAHSFSPHNLSSTQLEGATKHFGLENLSHLLFLSGPFSLLSTRTQSLVSTWFSVYFAHSFPNNSFMSSMCLMIESRDELQLTAALPLCSLMRPIENIYMIIRYRSRWIGLGPFVFVASHFGGGPDPATYCVQAQSLDQLTLKTILEINGNYLWPCASGSLMETATHDLIIPCYSLQAGHLHKALAVSLDRPCRVVTPAACRYSNASLRMSYVVDYNSVWLLISSYCVTFFQNK